MSSAKRNRELSRKLKDSVSLIQEELQLDPNGKFIKISLLYQITCKIILQLQLWLNVHKLESNIM